MTDPVRRGPPVASPRRVRGVSLVELLIGMAMGLLGLVVIAQVYANSQAQRRATTGAGDAQQAGALAAWSLGRELRMAGAGLESGRFTWGCTLDVRHRDVPLLPGAGAWPAPFAAMPQALRLWPVLVRDGGAGASDVIVAMSGRSAAGNLGLSMSVASAGRIATASAVDFAPGDLLLAVSTQRSERCLLGQVDSTFVPPAAEAAQSLPTSPTGAPYNRAAGFGALPPGGDWQLLNLGGAPSLAMFGVAARGGLLQRDLLAPGGEAMTLADNVVNMQVLYGLDDGSAGGLANDNVIDDWVQPGVAPWDFASLDDPASAVRVLQVKALRIALVTRGAERAATPAPATLTLFGALPERMTVDLPAADRPFPHQVLEFVVPLRNQSLALCAEARRAQALPQGNACD